MSDIPVIKVSILGNANVGKTSIVRQYCEGKFEISRVSTLGADFQTKTVPLPRGAVKLSIWDMGGQKHFEPVRRVFYSGTMAAALVYDVTDRESLLSLEEWYRELLAETGTNNFIVVGNKIDLDRAVPNGAGMNFAEKIGAKYGETSAKDGQGVEAMFFELAKLAAGNY